MFIPFKRLVERSPRPRAQCATSSPPPIPQCPRSTSMQTWAEYLKKLFNNIHYSLSSDATEELGITFDLARTILWNKRTANRTVLNITTVGHSQRHMESRLAACTFQLKRGILDWRIIWADEDWLFLSFFNHQTLHKNVVRCLMGSKSNQDHLRRMADRTRRRAELSCTKQGGPFEHLLWARAHWNDFFFVSDQMSNIH